MTATQYMIHSIASWIKDHTLGISGYIGISGYLAQIQPTVNRMGEVVETLTSTNVVLATLIAVVTLSIKTYEAIEKFKAHKKRKKDEANKAADQ